RYQAESAHFHSPGRNVRCAKCGEVWFQAAPESESQTEPEPVMTSTVVAADVAVADADLSARADASALEFGAQSAIAEPLPRRAARDERSWAAMFAQTIGWTAFFFLVGAIGWSIVQYRQTIAGLWPQSASFYALIGMPVNARGIALTNIAYRQD